ncbi:MAG: Cna B-type domain-containing protein, partial [Clostridia bacterium]
VTFDAPCYDDPSNTYYAITMDTVVDPKLYEDGQAHSYTFTNEATLYYRKPDGTEGRIGTAGATESIQYTAGSVLEKTVGQNGAYLQYKININTMATKLDVGQVGYLNLEDTLQNGLIIAAESVTVKDGFTGNKLAQVSGNPGKNEFSFVYDSAARKLTVKVPDEQFCVLNFDALLGGVIGDPVKVNNSITLTGKGISSSTGEKSFVVQEPSATIDSANHSLSIVKKDADAGTVITGAQFAVYLVKAANGSLINPAVAIGDTNARGEVQLPNGGGLKPDTLYCLKETKAAPGYQAKYEEYFLFKGNDEAHAASEIMAFEQARPDKKVKKIATDAPFDVLNKKVKLVEFEYGKIWADEGHESERPAKLVVKLYRHTAVNPVEVELAEYERTYLFDASNQGIYRFTETLTGLQANDDNNNPYLYVTKETAYDANNNEVSLERYRIENIGNVVENTYAYPELIVQKTFEGLVEGSVPAGVLGHFALLRKADQKVIAEWDLTRTQLTYTITAASKLLEYNTPYVLRETVVPEGYAKAPDVELSLTKNGNATVVTLANPPYAGVELSGNRLTVKNAIDTGISVTVVKQWNDDGAAANRPTATFQLCDHGVPMTGAAYAITLPDASGNNTYTWTKLEAKGHVYTVQETAPVGYASAQTGTATDGKGNLTVTFTNTLLTDIPVRKEWLLTSGKAILAKDIPAVELSVGLLRKIGGEAPAAVLDAQGKALTLTLHSGNGWAGIFASQPVYDAQGGKYEYSVAELTPLPEYTIAYLTGSDGTLVIQNKWDTLEADFSKKAVSGVEELPGAKLRLYEVNQSGAQVGADIDVWTSGTAPHRIGEGKLVAGHSYVMEEMDAPANYLIASSIKFTVKKDAATGALLLELLSAGGTVNGATITMLDTPIATTRLDVEKRWEEYGSAAFT